MKTRNILMGVIALMLVAVISVGATLAYISASDEKVTNTFSFGSMDVTLEEEEPEQVENETITPNDKGYDYGNIVPGQDLNKKPTISVDTDVPVYVFVRISGLGELITCDTINTTAWTAMSDVDGNGNGTYYIQLDASTTSPVTVFDGVTVSADAEGSESLNDIVIEVAAIQAAGFDTAAAALLEAEFQA